MLKLRPYRQSDAETIVKWCTDELSYYKWTAGVLGGYPLSAEKFDEIMAGAINNDKMFPFTALDENGPIGFFSLRDPGEVEDELRFGFVILDPAKRGLGYGVEMLKLGLRFVFSVYGARRATLGVFENNPPAYYCYKAAGFRDIPEEEDYYSILGEQWKCLELEMDAF